MVVEQRRESTDADGAEPPALPRDAIRQYPVQFKDFARSAEPATASGWMAESYHRQSRGELDAALKAARKAVQQSPEFGFAWVRVAELLFSFGKTQDAAKALDRGLQLAPRNAKAHALRGFWVSGRSML